MKKGIKYSLLMSTVAASGIAQANVLTLDASASYSLDGGATVNFSDVKSTSGVPAILTTPGFVDVLDFTQLSTGSMSGIHTYGDTSGTFGSRSSGAGLYDVKGYYLQDLVIVNETSTAQHYYYNFMITNGEISAMAGTLGAGEYANASYAMGVKLNGNSLFQSSGLVLTDDTSYSLSYTGTNIFDSSSCVSNGYCSASWGSQSYMLDLGVLDVGASLELTYDLVTRAWGNTGGPSTVYTETYEPQVSIDSVTGQTVYNCDLYGGEVTGTYNPQTGMCEYVNNAYSETSVARFGDPNSLTGQPIDPFMLVSAQPVGRSVPEPASIALLGVGFVGFVAARRRKKSV